SSGGLDVSIGRWTNPDIAPRRRNNQPFNSQQALFVTNRLSFQIKIFEFIALAPARKTGLLIAHVTQTRVLCRFGRLSENRRIAIQLLAVGELSCDCVHVTLIRMRARKRTVRLFIWKTRSAIVAGS